MPPAPLSRICQIESGSLSDDGYIWVCSPVNIPVADETAGLVGVQVTCPKGVELSKGGLSQVSVGFPFFKGDNGNANSPRVDLEIWALSGGVGTRLVEVDLPPFAWNGSGRGLVCGVAGILAEGFEVRARVDPTTANPCEILTRVRMVVDRRSSGEAGAWAINGSVVVASVTYTTF